MNVNKSFLLTLLTILSCKPQQAEISGENLVLETSQSMHLTQSSDIDQLKVQVITLRKQTAQLQLQLERENDRNGLLRLEMLGDSSSGCWASQPINELEITMNGAALETRDLGSQGETQPSEGSASTFKYTFGDRITYSNDEQSVALFRNGGQIILDDFAQLKIADIKYLIVEKQGVEYESRKKCDTKFFGISKDCHYDIVEQRRYRLDSISVKVNGQEIYQRADIGKTFEGDDRTWRDDQLALNPLYQTLMLRSDCPNIEAQ